MAARKWTEEQREQQSQKIRQWQPWKHSTGAKTAEGKAISARNAFTGGLMQKIKSLNSELNAILRKQRDQLNEL